MPYKGLDRVHVSYTTLVGIYTPATCNKKEGHPYSPALLKISIDMNML